MNGKAVKILWSIFMMCVSNASEFSRLLISGNATVLNVVASRVTGHFLMFCLWRILFATAQWRVVLIWVSTIWTHIVNGVQSDVEMENYRNKSSSKLTCPFRSNSLFVSFAFSNEITCFVNASNVNGVSG